MNTRLTSLIGALILLTTTVLAIAEKSTATLPTTTITFMEQRLEINVEIASSKTQREYGLMNRTSLANNQGMLFVYPDQKPRSVWMKNTLLPLDVLFLNREGKIVAMLNELAPCQQTTCPIYNSQKSAKYMLEVNAGFINSNQLQIGQQLRLP